MSHSFNAATFQERLVQLRQAIGAVTQFSEQALIASRLTADGLGAEWCDVFVWQSEQGTLTLAAAIGWDLPLPTPLVLSLEPDGDDSSSQPHSLPDLLNAHPTLRSLLSTHQVKSSISALILTAQHPIAILSARSTTENYFSPLETLMLEAIAESFAHVLDQQQVAALTVQVQQMTKDIASLRALEAILRESEERYALAANAANDGVWDWNVQTNEIYYSDQWKRILGYEPKEIENRLEEWFNRIHAEDEEAVKRAIALYCEGGTDRLELEHRVQHKSQTYCWVLNRAIAVRDANGKALRLTGVQTDITARKQAENRLLHDALHDHLTGLANRNLFMERLRHAINMAKRHDTYRFAVIFLDLDRFKVINDSLGHLAGDELLIGIAHRLSSCLRSSDTFARLGGDEFAIVLEYVCEEETAIEVVERIQQQLKPSFNLSGQEVFINASIGIILSPIDYDQPEELLRDADTAMYRAKALGRGRYEIFTPAMHANAVTLLHLETDLRRAIDRQEFVVHYQPVVLLGNRKIIGFEALVRWQHPERGLVSPADFIPIAEETGLIVPLGEWVLREACFQMRRWQEEFPAYVALTISVNISRKQFAQANLTQKIQQILQDSGLDARYLKLEITESALMDNPTTAIAMMLQLKKLGIQLSMDDFGTGYSSLSHLHLFPIDTLKIDPSFIKQADNDLEKLEIIRTVTTLAWNLGIDVVAEGVETQKQMAQLKLLRCELAQGYLFSKPLNQAAAHQLLSDSLSGQD